MHRLPPGWREYDPTRDYCGPSGKWWSALIRPNILNVDCNRAYWAHDERYRLGTTRRDRREADRLMLRDQNKAIATVYPWHHPLRPVAHGISFCRWLAVRLLGRSAFNAKT